MIKLLMKTKLLLCTSKSDNDNDVILHNIALFICNTNSRRYRNPKTPNKDKNYGACLRNVS